MEYFAHVLFLWVLLGVFVVGFTLHSLFTWPECKKDAASVRETYGSLIMLHGEMRAMAIVLCFLVAIVFAWPWLFTADDE